MSKKKQLSLDEHLEVAQHLKAARLHIIKAWVLLAGQYGKTKKATRNVVKAESAIDAARCMLDDDWAVDCTPSTPQGDAIHRAYGFLYYGDVDIYNFAKAVAEDAARKPEL